jgi:hypothetical protein
MLSKVKSYIKNNYENNVKPFFEKSSGKLAVRWSIVSALFYTVITATVALAPATPPQGELSSLGVLAISAMFIFLMGGMISTSIIAEKFLFLSGKTNKHYEKLKLLFCLVLSAIGLYSNSTNVILMYIMPILTMIGLVGSLDSALQLLKMKIEKTDEVEKENVVLESLAKDQTVNPQLKKQEEEIEIEKELGLTNYFKKQDK